ncbi:MAG: sigma-E factor negative regulatory protein [Hydrogenophaga sp.]|uniref:sigma-E factor negative regulatory protein n=2 Tax=Hydrogenophaga sp. TaxID=1904254 RepID=UPI0027306324|nr:sigma-E factor negative regulatory protein [Hydrogenophaga sp.]MDP2165880.1 sigma-E factor negative regulatory protein [Hydrogenophaga sp.]MDP3476123.1 sigma-E factor negative regulatory protein [Hydrogenophaga sp.]
MNTHIRPIRYLEVNMNAAQKHTDLLTLASAGAHAPDQIPLALQDFDVSSSLSALVDGEVHDTELDCLLAAHARGQETLEAWHSYQVIGDVLRASAPAVTAKAPQDFLAGIHARLQAEATLAQPLQPTLPRTPVAVAGHVRGPAANDAVFRWKMVAGLASLAAVMAVSWTLLGTAPSGAGGTRGSGPQLALMGANPGVTATQAQESTALVVNTAQGPLIRDVQLEALLAEHRHHGAMSALQMPAGFLRNATYDAAGR